MPAKVCQLKNNNNYGNILQGSFFLAIREFAEKNENV